MEQRDLLDTVAGNQPERRLIRSGYNKADQRYVIFDEHTHAADMKIVQMVIDGNARVIDKCVIEPPIPETVHYKENGSWA